MQRERERGLHIQLADRARHGEDAEAGRVLDGGVSDGSNLPTAPARTVLQSYLYAFAKRRPGAIVWIVDDDLRLDPLLADANGRCQRQPQPWLPALRQLQALRDSGAADVVIGRYTGDPPLPFAATVRTQLVDLAASLKWLAGQPPQAVLPDRGMENAALRHDRRDYYYDLSRRETDRLETPFWVTPEEPGERVGEAFERLARRAERILAGQQLFRPLVIEAGTDPLALGKGLQRGGNTFVLDVETLRLAPNPSPAVNGRPTRRSDMMWALLQERHFNRKVVTVPLALHQDRAGTAVAGLDVDKVLDDMRGYALFSALDAVPEVFASDGELRLHRAPAPEVARFVSRVHKFLNERLAAFRLSFHRVRGLASVLRDLAASEAWWRDERYRASRDHLRAFCDRLDESYAGGVLADIERAAAAIPDAEIERFLAELPAELERHRQRLADTSGSAPGFEQDRIANAKAVARRLATPAGPLAALGCGSRSGRSTTAAAKARWRRRWRTAARKCWASIQIQRGGSTGGGSARTPATCASPTSGKRRLPAAAFDLVVCQRVLCTVKDDADLRRILADLRAAVAADGRVVATLCDPRFAFCGPTPEAERDLPPNARYEDTFVWHKTVRASGRRRREVHGPEEALLAEFARVGLRETRRTTLPTMDLVHLRPASDHLGP